VQCVQGWPWVGVLSQGGERRARSRIIACVRTWWPRSLWHPEASAARQRKLEEAGRGTFTVRIDGEILCGLAGWLAGGLVRGSTR
jgi:hypothetical protein